MIKKDRLAETFRLLVAIDSVSRNEGTIAGELITILESMNAEIAVDSAGEKVGSNTGNLVARFAGNTVAPPLLFNAHMDTVEPGRGVKTVFQDGIFTSDGTTVLGADDKSAIAVLIETIKVLQKNDLPHGPLELVLTICEEVGLLGVKYLDLSLITAKYGYSLDATDIDGIVTQAPAVNRIELKVHGKDAHAGAAPEKGINAIGLAGKAIGQLEIGRIDHETTCNIGLIEGGVATNIVPDLVTVKGEVRSHDEKKLIKVTHEIVESFKKVVEDYQRLSFDNGLPRIEAFINKDFSSTKIPDNHPVVTLARTAGANLGRKMTATTTGGGADANIFFEKGIVMGVLGTGMCDMHTVRESIRLDDMVKTVELLLEIIKLQAKGAD